jgi:hypothetical protein
MPLTLRSWRFKVLCITRNQSSVFEFIPFRNKFFKMKTTALLLIASAAALTTALATETKQTSTGSHAPQSLELQQSGWIKIVTDIGDIQIRPEVVDTSTGKWRSLKSKTKFTPESGAEFTRTGDYAFVDGSEITHTTTAKIAGTDVVVKGSWTPGTAQGFSRIDLWFSYEAAQDLTIEFDGKPAFSNFNKSASFRQTGEFIFKRTSTGEFLFKLTGDFASSAIFFLEQNKEAGLTIRLANLVDCGKSTIGEATELNWTLAFKE